MKKILLLAWSTSFLFMLVTTFSITAAAYDPFGDICTTGTDDSSVCTDKENTTNPLTGTDGILLKVARLVSFITGVASVIVIILSGFKYVTANGDSNSVNSAKNTLLYAVIGLVLSLLAQGIVLFVINRL